MVFKEFDWTEDGRIESSELFALGTARRTTGQKKGVWTEEQNRRLVAKIDTDGDGKLSKNIAEYSVLWSQRTGAQDKRYNIYV